MILHPGVLALLCGSGIVLLMILYAAALGLKILLRWDFSSSSEEQLDLERRISLVSTLVSYALGFEILSLFLFIFTVDEIHSLFTGAMCATGTLNAAPLGWYALLLKILIFFAAACWLALNFLDGRAEDYPLVRRKFAWLLLLAPLVGMEFWLQAAFFLNLQPEVITSCCGSLFSAGGGGLAAELTALPVKPLMAAFYAVALLCLAAAWGCLRWNAAAFRWTFSTLAALFFPLSLAAVISFISLYIYALPTHHCPFDLLQQHYGYVGYPLYLGLFGGTLFGLLPGMAQPLKKIPSLQGEILRLEKRWILSRGLPAPPFPPHRLLADRHRLLPPARISRVLTQPACSFPLARLRRSRRQGEGHLGAMAESALHFDLAAVRGNDVPDDRHAEAEAADGRVRHVAAVKLVEGMPDLFFGHAEPRIAYFYFDLLCGLPYVDAYGISRRGKLDGVAEKIFHDLADFAAVDDQLRQQFAFQLEKDTAGADGGTR